MEDEITHLYIIGNGFDIFTGRKTRYSDFKQWLQREYVFVYDEIVASFGANGDWWNDFENQLGRLDIVKYVSKYAPKEKSLSEIYEEICNKKDYSKKGDGLPHFNGESTCANRLNGVFNILQYCFEKWVQDEQKEFGNPKYTHIEKEHSFFINFNYTDTLEHFYNIPEERVLHIHGRASNREHLVFGHDRPPYYGDPHGNDERRVDEVLNHYEKNPYYYIYHYNLHGKFINVKHVHVLGFSFSNVDIDYMFWIALHTSMDCDWEVSWFSEEDKKRINSFFSENRHLNGEIRLIQLEEVAS